MRSLVPLILFVLLSPAATASPNPVPALTLSIDPSSISLNNSSQTQTAVFNGTLSVDKLPLTKFNATIISSVSTNWSSTCTPSEFNLTSTTSQNFTCTVVVPGNTGGLIGAVKIDARGQGSGFVALASAQVIVAVSAPPKNQTGDGKPGNTTDNTTEDGPAYTLIPSTTGRSGIDPFRALLLAVAMGASCIGIYAVGRKRSTKRPKKRGG